MKSLQYAAQAMPEQFQQQLTPQYRWVNLQLDEELKATDDCWRERIVFPRDEVLDQLSRDDQAVIPRNICFQTTLNRFGTLYLYVYSLACMHNNNR